MRRTAVLLFSLLFSLLPTVGALGAGLRVDDLTTEMRTAPEGVSAPRPRFSWKLTSDRTDVMQAACRIEVASSKNGFGSSARTVWDSGRVETDGSILVPYGGAPLKAGTKYWWRVSVWTTGGQMAVSEPECWSTALAADGWAAARWIGLNDGENLRVEDNRTILPARYLRREFLLDGAPRRAMLYVSGLGSSECHINGERVGSDVFGPLPTWYDASVPYLTYDVTELLRRGGNAIGVVLGNGRYLTMRREGIADFGLPRLIARLEVELADGRRVAIVSDGEWRATAEGPIRANNEFDGETFDARMELGDWTRRGYDASAWRQAETMDAPKGRLVSQPSPSLGVVERITPLSVTAVPGGRFIVDMGQNMVGFARVTLTGRKDAPVSMRFAETLKPDGRELYVDNLRSALCTDTYIPARDGEFTWEPSFVYHGFRFIELSGAEGTPSVEDFTGLVVSDPMTATGSFDSSDDMVNAIYRNAFWGIRGNYRGMPTDCPQRDERMGWLGDRATGALGESFVFDNATLYNKWLVDIEESMNGQGSISVVSPRYWTIYNDDVTWPSAYFHIAEMLYRQFGDDTQIRERYPSMKRWVEYMAANRMEDYIVTSDTYGDWCMPPESPELIHSEDPARRTDGRVLSTSVFYGILTLMQRFATMNGEMDDAARYASLAAGMRDAYNARYFDESTAGYDNNTVTANILSLQLGLVPERYRERLFENIVRKTEIDCGGHVSTGVVGIQHLMRGLSRGGAPDLAWKIATNDTYPSWGYMVRKGATTIWELWNGDTANPAMNSHNHVMLLGDLVVWMYEDLAGIRNDEGSAGFKKILFEPVFPQGLTHVEASYESPHGLIESAWRREGDRLEWDIAVPANATATVRLPARFGEIGVVERSSGRELQRTAAGADGRVTIALGSGRYTLASTPGSIPGSTSPRL